MAGLQKAIDKIHNLEQSDLSRRLFSVRILRGVPNALAPFREIPEPRQLLSPLSSRTLQRTWAIYVQALYKHFYGRGVPVWCGTYHPTG